MLFRSSDHLGGIPQRRHQLQQDHPALGDDRRRVGRSVRRRSPQRRAPDAVGVTPPLFVRGRQCPRRRPRAGGAPL